MHRLHAATLPPVVGQARLVERRGDYDQNRTRTAVVALALATALIATAGGALAANAAPANDIDIDQVKKNKRKGTAKILVEVPGAGQVSLEGTGRSKSGTEQANGAGTVAIRLHPNTKGKRKLRNGGKVPFNAVITYTPQGGGQPSTEAQTVNLRLKR